MAKHVQPLVVPVTEYLKLRTPINIDPRRLNTQKTVPIEAKVRLEKVPSEVNLEHALDRLFRGQWHWDRSRRGIVVSILHFPEPVGDLEKKLTSLAWNISWDEELRTAGQGYEEAACEEEALQEELEWQRENERAHRHAVFDYYLEKHGTMSGYELWMDYEDVDMVDPWEDRKYNDEKYDDYDDLVVA